MQRFLDHIVILVPHSTLQALPPFLADALTVIDGGVHAGGETENKLILFRDGTYIELIAFVDGLDPEKRKAHRWGDRAEGTIVDWALTLLGEQQSTDEEFSRIQQLVRQSGTGIKYTDLLDGGRTRPDGAVLKWVTSMAVEASSDGGDLTTTPLGAGELPFWCLDRTPRPLRVPPPDEHNSVHPAGAIGVAAVTIQVPDPAHETRTSAVYEAVLAETESPPTAPSNSGNRSQSWRLQAPYDTGSGVRREVRLESSPRGTNGPDRVHIALTLYTEKKEGVISGSLVDGRRLDIELRALTSQAQSGS